MAARKGQRPEPGAVLQFILEREDLRNTLEKFSIKKEDLFDIFADYLPPKSGERTEKKAREKERGERYRRLILYTDGAARGNPGESGAGIILKTPEGEEVSRMGKYLGKMTNNSAEYTALILGLELAKEFGAEEVTILSDSELMIRQLRGEYKVRAAHLRELFDRVKGQLSQFKRYQLKRIDREKNREADFMANRAIDEKL